MRLLHLAALAIALSATACATSSPPDSSPPAELAAAEARAQAAVEHPQLPPVLQQCLDGTQPWTEPVPGATDAFVYRCPIPPDLQAALSSGAPMDVVASKAIGDLQKMTDMHFQANHWSDHPHTGAPEAEVTTSAQKPVNAAPWWHFGAW